MVVFTVAIVPLTELALPVSLVGVATQGRLHGVVARVVIDQEGARPLGIVDGN